MTHRALIYKGSCMKDLTNAYASPEQLIRIEHIEISSGRGKGNEILQVWNGMLYFEVNVSRGFDIRACYFKGLPVSWFSPCAHASPSSYDPTGDGWNKGFEGGLLTTCGLEHAGKVEENYGLHGRFSYQEAEIDEKRITKNEIILSATIREVKVGGYYYQLRRTITSDLLQNRIQVTDTITNRSSIRTPFMLLYHINWNPLLFLDEPSLITMQGSWELVRASKPSMMATKYSEMKDGEFDVISCTDVEHKDYQVKMQLKTQEMQIEVSYDSRQLPVLTQWRLKGNGGNVISWEPGNVSTRGYQYHEKVGSLPFLEPDEEKSYSLTFRFIEK